MGQWYYEKYNSIDNYALIYTFKRSGKRNNTIYIQNHYQLIYFTYWFEESSATKGKMMVKLPYTDFRQGIIYIMFSGFENIERLVYEIEKGDLVSYMEIV